MNSAIRIESDLRLSGNLWHNKDFTKLWTGDTVTQFTGQVTSLAIPTIAILTLNVSSVQLGILSALGFVAFPTLGLFAGVLMDRVRRKRVMIVVNIIRLLALATIPLAYFLGLLSLLQLYTISFLTGLCSLFFDVAYQSYLPTLVEKDNLVEGNQKLQLSASAAQVFGPSIASMLMGLLGAALSIIVDVLGFLISVITLASIRKTEQSAAKVDRKFFSEMKEGIRVVIGNSLLWTQAGCTATINLGTSMFGVVILLYAYRILGISKSTIGFAFSIGAVGFLIGVLLSSRIVRQLGLGNAVLISTILNFGLLLCIIPLGDFSIISVGLGLLLSNMGVPIYNINQVSLRQIITPIELQGRMNATMRTVVWGTIPAGSFIGGLLATEIGIVATILVSSMVAGLSFIWIWLGPTIKLRNQPEP